MELNQSVNPWNYSTLKESLGNTSGLCSEEGQDPSYVQTIGNSMQLDDLYPLPIIEELLDRVSGACYISTLNLAKGYYQIPVKPEDQKNLEYEMPFGLKGAPSTFQLTMNDLL